MIPNSLMYSIQHGRECCKQLVKLIYNAVMNAKENKCSGIKLIVCLCLIKWLKENRQFNRHFNEYA